MFTLLVERKQKVLWTRFSGILRRELIHAQGAAARKLAESEGPLRALIDFRDVEKIDIPLETLKTMGHSPQNLTDQKRVLVASTDEHFGMARLFATYQGLSGNVEPLVVRTMEEAHRALQLSDPHFEPVPLT